MAYEDALLTKNFEVWMGGAGATAGVPNSGHEADAKDLSSTAATALASTIGGTADDATLNGWTMISTEGWAFVAGNYSGPQSELSEQDGAQDAMYRQDLEVQDLTWNFQIDVNAKTIKVFGGLTNKRRRFIIVPNGVKSGSHVDQFVGWVNAPTQDNGGKQQYNVTVSLNGPVTQNTLT